MNILHHGDSLEVLKSFEDNSFDSLITDPPAGISFMGKEWDSNKGGTREWIKWLSEVMVEVYRVLKPGAHGLVWALPRTSHRTAIALENAGFEIRDIVNHIFGSGFPKSLDISKAIDKAAGARREVIGLKPIAKPDSECWSQPNKNVDVGGFGQNTNDYGSDKEGWSVKNNPITAPATPEAKQWEGFGTALKPAHEHWILVRKTLSEKTVAANVLKWGTGGLNIDGSRIDLQHGEVTHGSGAVMRGGVTYSQEGSGFNPDNERRGVPNITSTQGRFPANLVLSEDAARELDEHSGVSSGRPVKALGESGKNKGSNNVNYGGGVATTGYTDTGGASRFFYVAKASAKDKGADNKHPTVKSTKLMEYLIKLITPPNGKILDPFMGSGSTGVAAKRLGFEFVGIEKEAEYFEIAKKRHMLTE